MLLAKIKAHPRVLDIEVEPTDGWFLTLRAGWRMKHDPCVPVHCGGAYTLTEAMKMVRSAQPCDCQQCRDERTALKIGHDH